MKKLFLLLLLLISINSFSQKDTYQGITYNDRLFRLKEENFTEYLEKQIGNHHYYKFSFTVSLPDSSVWWNERDSEDNAQMFFKSKNKGKTWEFLYQGEKVAEYMFFIDENVGYGFINKEDDYFAFSSNKRKDTVKLKYLSNYILNGENKSYFEKALVLNKTVDGGKTWNEISVINNINNINNKENILPQYKSLYNRNKNFPSLNYLIKPEIFDFNMINDKLFIFGGDNNYDINHPIGYMSSDNGLTWNISILPESVKNIHGYIENVRYIRKNYYSEVVIPYENPIHLISEDGINWNVISTYVKN